MPASPPAYAYDVVRHWRAGGGAYGNFGKFLKEKLVLTRNLIIDYGMLYINKLGVQKK